MLRASGWLAEQHAADQRRFTHLLFGSFVAHALVVGGLSIAPSPDAPRLPEVLTVDLVAALPSPGALPRPKPPAPPKPEPAPVVPPAPAPAPPPPKQIVLPKQAPKAIPKQRPAPPPPKPEPIDYEDALSQLRNELGEKTPAPVAPAPTQAAEAPPTAAAEPSAAESAQAAVDREIAAWLLQVKRHVESRYITPPEFRRRGLSTGLQIVLTSTGELVGMPRVVRPSGDPFFDDNALRAVMMSAPVPAPPQAGSYTFVFYSEDR